MIKWLSQNSKTPAAAAFTEGVNVLSELKALRWQTPRVGVRSFGAEVVDSVDLDFNIYIYLYIILYCILLYHIILQHIILVDLDGFPVLQISGGRWKWRSCTRRSRTWRSRCHGGITGNPWWFQYQNGTWMILYPNFRKPLESMLVLICFDHIFGASSWGIRQISGHPKDWLESFSRCRHSLEPWAGPDKIWKWDSDSWLQAAMIPGFVSRQSRCQLDQLDSIGCWKRSSITDWWMMFGWVTLTSPFFGEVRDNFPAFVDLLFWQCQSMQQGIWRKRRRRKRWMSLNLRQRIWRKVRLPSYSGPKKSGHGYLWYLENLNLQCVNHH